MSRRLVTSEERRLRVVFQRALLVTVAGIGCGTTRIEEVIVPAEGGAPDAAADASVDAAREAAPPDPCAATLYSPTPPDTCGDYYRYPCGLPTDLTIRGDCYFSVNDCNALCPDIHYNCHAIEGYCSTSQGDAGVPADGGDAGAPGDGGLLPTQDGHVVPDEAGAVVIDCSVCPGSPGRMPAGLVPSSTVRASSRLGAWLAHAARLEAASVTAFERMRAELSAQGAPRELVDAAGAAAHDEVRHTRAMARLARRHGGRYERPTVAPVPARSRREMAEENVVEGCARETFSALLAAYQAAHTDDMVLARVLLGIAADEQRHAALSWAVARWALGASSADERAALRRRFDETLDDLARDAGDDPFAGVAALPDRAVRRALVAELRSLGPALAA